MAAVAEVAEVETCTDIVTLHTAKGPHIYPSQITLKQLGLDQLEKEKKQRNQALQNMTVAELRAECLARALNDERLKKDLQQNLKEQLKGVQRVPALLINEQDKSTEEINLCTESLTNGIFSILAVHLYVIKRLD